MRADDDRLYWRNHTDALLDAIFGTPPECLHLVREERHYLPGPPATPKQVHMLQDWSYRYDASRLTEEEAHDVIDLAMSWAANHPASNDEVLSDDDGYDNDSGNGYLTWPPTTAARWSVALRGKFRWPAPQYQREADAARNEARADFMQMPLAERIALRRSQGPDRLTTYVKTRLIKADPDLRTAIYALLTQEELRAADTDPDQHQASPAPSYRHAAGDRDPDAQ